MPEQFSSPLDYAPLATPVWECRACGACVTDQAVHRRFHDALVRVGRTAQSAHALAERAESRHRPIG